MNGLDDKPIDVLIVGAGPVGLMMACQLAVHQIPFRIIDKKLHPSTYSGALIVHARTMEIFDQMGMAKKVLHESILPNKLSILFNGKKRAQILLKDIGKGLSKFPNLHLIEQSKTEQLLLDFATTKGTDVEWKKELKRFSQDEKTVTSVIQLPDGREEIIKSKYLIAADGGKSTVREQLQIPFVGKTHPVSLFIIDCKAEMELPPDEMCFSFSNAATSGFFPLKNNRKRVDGVIPKRMEGSSKITFEDIEKNIAERLNMNIGISNPEWFSVSRSNQYYAISYQAHLCFLAGDAAHTFTPVGAQGMNTGLQDAYNLAWKLAFVLQHNALPTLLNTYSNERVTLAKNTANSSGKIYNLVTSRNFFVKSFRIHVFPYVLKWILILIERQRAVRQFSFKILSEININYRKSPLSIHKSTGKFSKHAPKPGDRLPYLIFNINGKKINIQSVVSPTKFTLLIFTDSLLPTEIKAMADNYQAFLVIETMELTPKTKILFEHFGIKNKGCYLIRPDMYIAFRWLNFDTSPLNQYFSKLF